MKPLKIGDLTATLPIVQGGMGVGVSLHRLAAAVAEGGGIGTISGVQAGWREPDFHTNPVEANCRAIAREIGQAKEKTRGIIALNLMAAMKNYDVYVKEAVKNKVDIIVSGAGLPRNLPTLVAGSTTKIMPIVSSARAFQLIAKAWLKQGRLPDGVVLEGALAGGHLGFSLKEMEENSYKSLETLIPEIKSAIAEVEESHGVKIPLIAGGGIHSGEDVKRILDLGADGVQLGTRFIATEECDAHPNYKQTFLSATEDDMRIIKSPVGLAARAIRNDFLDTAYGEGIPVNRCFTCLPHCKPSEIPFCISRYLFEAAEGRSGLVFSGQNGYQIDKILSVKALMAELSASC